MDDRIDRKCPNCGGVVHRPTDDQLVHAEGVQYDCEDCELSWGEDGNPTDRHGHAGDLTTNV